MLLTDTLNALTLVAMFDAEGGGLHRDCPTCERGDCWDQAEPADVDALLRLELN